jgi:hypothetical protein
MMHWFSLKNRLLLLPPQETRSSKGKISAAICQQAKVKELMA